MSVIHFFISASEVYLPIHYSWLQLVSQNEQSLNLLVFWVFHFLMVYIDSLTRDIL